MTLVVAAKANQAIQTQGLAEVLTKKRIVKRTAKESGDGSATIILAGLDNVSFQTFNVYESIKIFSDSSDTSTVTLYEAAVLPQNFVGGSDRGNLNEWAETPPLFTTDPLIIQWTNLSADANCFARIQYSEMTLVPVRI